MDHQNREQLVSDILKSLLQEDFLSLRNKWKKFEDIVFGHDRVVAYAYQQTLSEMGFTPVVDLIIQKIDEPYVQEESDSIFTWACLMFCQYMTQIMPVLRQLWTMKDTFCPLLIKMLKHDHYLVRHCGIITCCQLILSSSKEEMVEAIDLGIIDYDLLMGSLKKSDVQFVSVLTFKHLFNQILRIYLNLAIRGGEPLRKFIWKTRILELADDLSSRKDRLYTRASPKAEVDEDFSQLLTDLHRVLTYMDKEPVNMFSGYPNEVLILQHPKRQNYPISCSYPGCFKSETISKESKSSSYIQCEKCALAVYCSETCRNKHWVSGHNQWCCPCDSILAGDECSNSSIVANEECTSNSIVRISNCQISTTSNIQLEGARCQKVDIF